MEAVAFSMWISLTIACVRREASPTTMARFNVLPSHLHLLFPQHLLQPRVLDLLWGHSTHRVFLAPTTTKAPSQAADVSTLNLTFQTQIRLVPFLTATVSTTVLRPTMASCNARPQRYLLPQLHHQQRLNRPLLVLVPQPGPSSNRVSIATTTTLELSQDVSVSTPLEAWCRIQRSTIVPVLASVSPTPMACCSALSCSRRHLRFSRQRSLLFHQVQFQQQQQCYHPLQPLSLHPPRYSPHQQRRPPPPQQQCLGFVHGVRLQ
jgi:hypothetical protein